jgi:hypothetical protein
MATHEDFSRSHQVKGSSNRVFGWTFVVVFLLVGLWPLGFSDGLRWWAVIVAAIVMVATLTVPALLELPKRLWLRFGALLHRLVSPVVLAIMFYCVITPMGLLMRALGKDLLAMRRSDPDGTYWVKREPPGPKPSSMSKQF